MSAATDDPAIRALLDRLPDADTEWPQALRVRWLRAMIIFETDKLLDHIDVLTAALASKDQEITERDVMIGRLREAVHSASYWINAERDPTGKEFEPTHSILERLDVALGREP